MAQTVIAYDKTIKSHFSEGDTVLICLFPFYRQVFAKHYNWEANLKLAYPLLSTITWEEISEDVGFGSLKRLALGILGLREPFKTELAEYCEWKKIDIPDYASNKIPVSMFIPLLRYLKSNGQVNIETREVDRFPDSESKQIGLVQREEFELYGEVQGAKHLQTENGLEMLLPDYDCPYVIISGKKHPCIGLAGSCGFEYIEVNKETRFDWWDQ